MHDPRSLPADRAAAERELYEQVGYVRCQCDAARATLLDLERSKVELLARQDEVARQIEVVRAEIEARRKELEERLGVWCGLDELDLRTGATDLIKRVDAVRSSLTYRVAAMALAVVNKVRRFVTLQWLRGGRPS